jgi:hypothetical protein
LKKNLAKEIIAQYIDKNWGRDYVHITDGNTNKKQKITESGELLGID